MKKKILIKMCVLCVSLWIIYNIGSGFYWYYKSDGENVSIKLSSQYSTVSADIEIYINDVLVFKDENYLSFLQSIKVKYPFGFYDLKVIIDKKEYIRKFVLFPVKFIYVEMSKYQIKNDSNHKLNVIIDISSSPINMM